MKSRLGIHHLVASTLAALLGVCTPGAHAQTFTNSAAINFPASTSDGRATLYPSPITVTGGPTSIGYLSVTLSGFTHSYVADTRVLLVSPTGQKILLMSNTNASANASNNTLTFVPDNTAKLPFSFADVVSGIYSPSVYGSFSMPSPAPSQPYGTSLAPLIGTDANGTWSLYVCDILPQFDDGTFSGGWSITFNQIVQFPAISAFTYQGVLTSGGTPISGNTNVRFTLCNSEVASVGISAQAPSITRSFTDISGGKISTTLDFGSAIDANQARWLNIEVESPPGSGFVTLLPRQQITPTPQARIAQRAVTADSATTASFATTANTANTANNATTANTATQLAPGRARIRGDAGASSTSPGIWFASPVTTPFDRGFVGMLDDSNMGFFINGNWRFRVNAAGNVAIGDGSGVAPPERLTITGNIQLNTSGSSIPSKLAFGAIGDEGSGAENSDAVYFSRVNTAADSTELRLIIGDNGGPTGLDSLRICTTSVSGILVERFRFQSDGQALKPGGGSWAALSDPRAKHDIAPLTGTLDKLLSLRGYSFLYNDDRVASGQALPGTQFGLMADEVARVFPDWVSTDASGTRYVTERATTALMVEALRDLRKEKDEVAAQAKADRREVEALKAEVAELKSLINQLARERAEQPK